MLDPLRQLLRCRFRALEAALHYPHAVRLLVYATNLGRDGRHASDEIISPGLGL